MSSPAGDGCEERREVRLWLLWIVCAGRHTGDTPAGPGTALMCWSCCCMTLEVNVFAKVSLELAVAHGSGPWKERVPGRFLWHQKTECRVWWWWWVLQGVRGSLGVVLIVFCCWPRFCASFHSNHNFQQQGIKANALDYSCCIKIKLYVMPQGPVWALFCKNEILGLRSRSENFKGGLRMAFGS